MAAVISDFVPDSSRFHHSSHTMIAGAGQQRSPAGSQYRQSSRSREVPPSPRHQPTSILRETAAQAPSPQAPNQQEDEDAADDQMSSEDPSPQSSSTVRPAAAHRFRSQENIPRSAAPYESVTARGSRERESMSSPSGPSHISAIPRSARSLDDVKRYGGNTIKVRDLAHIQSFATDEFLSYRRQAERRQPASDSGTCKYEISGMPIMDIIEMVAGLLTKITTTNDRQHENLNRHIPSGDATNMSGNSQSVLAFHGKNVPSITILSYLSRIHKYCPTTYEVFLSLLVYFDRMTERVNAAPLEVYNKDAMDIENSRPSSGYSAEGSDLADSPPSSRSVPEMNSDLEKAQYSHASPTEQSLNAFPLSHFFVVDSFNIHRLVIAGVTCASKFFSDVFYTNSRYAKVGGLPLAELNHLELQFLLLNDFRLSVPVEELEAYGTMLVEFYAREVIAQRERSATTDQMAYRDGGEDSEMVSSP